MLTLNLRLCQLNQILSIDKYIVFIYLNIITDKYEIKQRVLTDMKSKSDLMY
jgi:hypothetical protein